MFRWLLNLFRPNRTPVRPSPTAQQQLRDELIRSQARLAANLVKASPAHQQSQGRTSNAAAPVVKKLTTGPRFGQKADQVSSGRRRQDTTSSSYPDTSMHHVTSPYPVSHGHLSIGGSHDCRSSDSSYSSSCDSGGSDSGGGGGGGD